MKRLTKTIALRLQPTLYRAIQREQTKDESLSDTVRRLLSQATTRPRSEP